MCDYSGEFLSFYEAKAIPNVKEQLQLSLKVTINVHLIKLNFESLGWLQELRLKEAFKQWDSDIRAFYENTKETAFEFHRKMIFKKNLDVLLKSFKEEGFNWHFMLVPTGSTVSGLASRNSDLDLCLFIPEFSSYFESEADAARHILQIVRHAVIYSEQEGNDTNIRSMDLVFASVPVLKITTHDNLEVDLSVCTTRFLSGAHNSLLIGAFGNIDHRFIPFCHFVKKWATRAKIKNPRGPNACFNSYAVICLVIHFFQCGVYPPILPNLKQLYPNFYAQSETVFPTKIDYSNPLPPEFTPLELKNQMGLGELFVRFLQYWLDFDFKNFYITLNESTVKRRNSARSKHSVLIEDPIDEHNPGRTVRDIPHVKEMLRRTLNYIHDSSVQEHYIPSALDILEEHYLHDNENNFRNPF